MAALSIQVPYPVFYDRDGQPLDNGNIYIGVANLDPVTNPLQVYYDEALTITASQPLITSGGYVYRNGTPTQLYVNANDFSITVNDSKNLFVYSFPEATGLGVGASTVEYDPPFTGAVTSGYTVQDKLSQTISVKDFGAVGDGIADDTAEIQAALTAGAGRAVYFPGGTYLISATLTVPADTMVTGDGYGSVVFQNTREQNVFELSDNCTVQHLRLKGDGASSGGVSFEKNNGIYIVSKRNIKVLNCFFHAFEFNGIYINSCENIEVLSNYCWDNKYSVASGSDIAVYALSGDSQRIIISKNFCFSNNSIGIMASIDADVDIIVEGNIIVALDATTWAEVSSGNLARRSGIFLGYNGLGGRRIIANNICRNTRQTGIYYQSLNAPIDGVQIIGNQCTKNGINAPAPTGLSSGIYVATQGNGDLIANNLVEDFADTSFQETAGIKIGPFTGTQVAANPSTLVVNNIIRSSANIGILLTGVATNVEVRGNVITNSTAEDIAVLPSVGFATVGNHIIKQNRIERTNTNYPAIFCIFQTSPKPYYIQDNYILGFDSTVVSDDNVGIKWPQNANIFVTGNTISGFYNGIYQSDYLTGRAFSQQFIDRNSILNCNIGIRIRSAVTAAVLPVQDNVFVNVTNNVSGGPGAYTAAYIAQRFGNKIYFQSASAPAVGDWIVGDRAQQLTPVVGQPKGWMCTVAGAPGTWVSEGNL